MPYKYNTVNSSENQDYGMMYDLFSECLTAKYTNVENSGSYACEDKNGILYIYFEKSNGNEDWQNNLSYHAMPVKRGDISFYCHEGFLKVWNSIQPHIDKILRNTDAEMIYIVGYSHGAALALLCHEYIENEYPEFKGRVYGYGFGCPRVIWGNVKDENRIWKNFYVVRNLDDIVTHLPPYITGYRHVGNLVEIGRMGNYSGIEAHMAENYLLELSLLIEKHVIYLSSGGDSLDKPGKI